MIPPNLPIQLPVPCRGIDSKAYKNGSWAWNISLPRDKTTTEPRPGLSLCLGRSGLVSCSLSTILSLLKALVLYGT